MGRSMLVLQRIAPTETDNGEEIASQKPLRLDVDLDVKPTPMPQ